MSRVAARRVVPIAGLLGVLLVVSAGFGGTAFGGRTKATTPLSASASQLSIGLRVTPRTATRGKRVTYLLRLSNVGAASARLVRVCYQIPGVPPELTLVSAPPGFQRGHTGLVCRRFASLPAHATLIFKFVLQVPASARGGVILSTAYARASGMVSFISAQAPLTIGVSSKCGSSSAC